MAAAWFLCPYKLDLSDGLVSRYCAMNDFTPQVDNWSHIELSGDQALVRVKANEKTLADIALIYKQLSDTEATQVSNRSIELIHRVDERIVSCE